MREDAGQLTLGQCTAITIMSELTDQRAVYSLCQTSDPLE